VLLFRGTSRRRERASREEYKREKERKSGERIFRDRRSKEKTLLHRSLFHRVPDAPVAFPVSEQTQDIQTSTLVLKSGAEKGLNASNGRGHSLPHRLNSKRKKKS